MEFMPLGYGFYGMLFDENAKTPIKLCPFIQVLEVNQWRRSCAARLYTAHVSAPLASVSFREFGTWHPSASQISVFVSCFLAALGDSVPVSELFLAFIKMTAAFPLETFHTFS